MIFDFKDIICIGIILVMYLWMAYGLKKDHGLTVLKGISGREKKIDALFLAVFVFVISVYTAKSGVDNVFSGIVDDAVNTIASKVYGSETALIYIAEFVCLILPGYIMAFCAVEKLAERFRFSYTSFFYLILFAMINRTTYMVLYGSVADKVLFLVGNLLVLCVSDCILYDFTKKKMLYIITVIAVIVAVCVSSQGCGVYPALSIGIILLEGVILSVLLKYLKYLRPIWKKLILLFMFIGCYLVNWQL